MYRRESRRGICERCCSYHSQSRHASQNLPRSSRRHRGLAGSTCPSLARFLFDWLKALRWQRLPEMEKLGDTLVNHYDGIAAYCDHRVRFGVVESLNTTIKAVLRRARGMRDDAMLLLKLKWATARPIRSAGDLARFLQPSERYSNR